MKNILLVLASVAPAVVGQLVLKSAISRLGVTPDAGLAAYLLRVFTTPLTLTALGLYGVSALVWTVVLGKLELSLAYPMVAMGYVLIVFLSWWLLDEPVNASRLLGLALICGGVILISRS
jgi:multidrug transporter EmrE-like cation transporter